MGTSARKELIDAVEYTSMKTEACQIIFREGFDTLLTDLATYLPQSPNPVFPLTEKNLKIKQTSTEMVEHRYTPELDFEDNRDQDGRPTQAGAVYLPSPAPFIQESSGLLDRRTVYREATTMLLKLRQRRADDMAFHFAMFPNTNLAAFESSSDDVPFEDQEREAIQNVDNARRLYEASRQIVQQDILTRHAASELSYPSQISDNIEGLSADIVQRRESRWRAPPPPVQSWQAVIAETCSRDLQPPSRPASVASQETIRFSEQLSNGNGSDDSVSGESRRRRERWLRLRGPLGFEMDRYGNG